VTTVRLALGGGRTTTRMRSIADRRQRPALLVSYYYLKDFLKIRERLSFRDWVLDSGAFSAKNVGAQIDLRAYAETAKELAATDASLTEIFALDVIGDARATRKNTEKLWGMGIEAIPTFHVGEKLADLRSMARDYPKIALGGSVGYKTKLAWTTACFREVWPKRIHGFGFGSRRDVLALPWHSVDATNWELGPTAFGVWHGYSRTDRQQTLSVRGSKQDLRCEVDYFLRMEREAGHRWRNQMAEIEEDGGPAVRLVCSTGPPKAFISGMRKEGASA